MARCLSPFFATRQTHPEWSAGKQDRHRDNRLFANLTRIRRAADEFIPTVAEVAKTFG
jgi:hypothetical protein